MNRRELILFGAIGLTSAKHAVSSSQSTPVISDFLNPPTSYLPEGSLDPWTELPPSEFDKDYSTELVEPPVFPDDCTIMVFPRADDTVSAFSSVYRSNEDLTTPPSYLLLQTLTFKTEEDAESKVDRVVEDARSIMAHACSQDVNDQSVIVQSPREYRFEGLSPSKWRWALQVLQLDDRIFVLRSRKARVAPWNLIESTREHLESILPDQETIDLAGLSLSKSYGPIDIHPSVYMPDTCA